MLTRRQFLVGTGALAASACAREVRPPAAGDVPVEVNDVHSQLNPTRVHAIVQPRSVDDVRRALRAARRDERAVSIAGARHAMGGQQFGVDTMLLDMRGMRRILDLDAEKGVIEVEAGVEWPELIAHLVRVQQGQARQWGIVQKQTGADRLTIGGALAANAHGRGLRFKPMVQDIESFTLVDAGGDVLECSRERNGELFRLAVGGYGLFGVVTAVRLRLAPRQKVRRIVEVRDAGDLAGAFAQRIAEGFTYGDFQCSTDTRSRTFLRTGVFSCYRPIADDAPIPGGQQELQVDDWRQLLYLGHADKRRAFELYRDHYVATSGQVYWSDEHQLSTYIDDYHRELDRRTAAPARATEMISELYVPRARFAAFVAEMRDDFRRHGVELIYSSIRLIERDDETFLAWAREPWLCTVVNLHVVHTPDGLAHGAAAFRRLIDMAARHGGSYFLTYHRWATRVQVERCHPQLRELLRVKRRIDPEERFQSEWYRHYRTMFA
jgi:FAD/FMN-containing dehydrogenase